MKSSKKQRLWLAVAAPLLFIAVGIGLFLLLPTISEIIFGGRLYRPAVTVDPKAPKEVATFNPPVVVGYHANVQKVKKALSEGRQYKHYNIMLPPVELGVDENISSISSYFGTDVFWDEMTIQQDHSPTSGPYIQPLALGVARIEGASLSKLHNIRAEVQYYHEGRKIADRSEISSEMSLPSSTTLHQFDPSHLLIAFKCTGLGQAHVVNSVLYDADTETTLTSKVDIYPSAGQNHLVSHQMPLFHPARLQWCLDMAHNLVDEKYLPIEKGAWVEFAADLILYNESGPLSQGRVIEHRMEWSYYGIESTLYPAIMSKPDYDLPNLSVSLIPIPETKYRYFTAQFADGNHHPLGEESVLNEICTIISLYDRDEASAARYVRVRKYEKIHRFKVPLGRLPGTPAVNKDVKNLFDVKIPGVYLHVMTPDVLISEVAEVQIRCNYGMASSGPPPSPAADLYTTIPDYVTPRELVEKYYNPAVSGDTYYYDPATHTIVLRRKQDSYFKSGCNWLKNIGQDILE